MEQDDINNIRKYQLERDLLSNKKIIINYFFDPIQYDGRIKRVLKYFYLNNEPLFYLAASYCSIFTLVTYSILRRKIIKSLYRKFINRNNKSNYLQMTLNLSKKDNYNINK